MPEYTVGVAGSVASTTATPGGAAGGDLSGTYPNPSVATAALSAVNGTGLTKGDILAATANNGVGRIALGSAGFLAVGSSGLPVYSHNRERLALLARGFVSENFPMMSTAATRTPTANAASGNMALGLLGLRAGDTVTNLHTYLTSNGTAVVFAKMALFNSAGGFIRATSSQSADFNSGASKLTTLALTSAYAVTADGGYYIGFLQYGTVGGGLAGAGGSTAATFAGPSGVRSAARVSNQTDITGDVTPTDGGNNESIWVGCS